MLLGTNQERIEQLLVEAFEAGARFDETLSELLPRVCADKKITDLVERLQNEAHLIKVNKLQFLKGNLSKI